MTPSSPEEQLAAFLAKYDSRIAEQLQSARSKLRSLLPGAFELVYDNYNALVIGYSATERPSEAILSLAAMPRWVSLVFIRGVDLPDPDGLLNGKGNQVRSIRLAAPEDIDLPAVRALIDEAVQRSAAPFEAGKPHRLIIRSVSARQRPRRPTRED